MKRLTFKHLLSALCLLAATSAAQAERVKDLVTIQGVRANQLIGYGLVVGLNGTGDQTTQTPFCLLYTSPSPRDRQKSRMPSSA